MSDDSEWEFTDGTTRPPDEKPHGATLSNCVNNRKHTPDCSTKLRYACMTEGKNNTIVQTALVKFLTEMIYPVSLVHDSQRSKSLFTRKNGLLFFRAILSVTQLVSLDIMLTGNFFLKKSYV